MSPPKENNGNDEECGKDTGRQQAIKITQDQNSDKVVGIQGTGIAGKFFQKWNRFATIPQSKQGKNFKNIKICM